MRSTAHAEPWNIYLPEATTNAKALEPFFEALRNERGAIVMGGDSNQLFNNYGWSDGVERAWTTRFGAYATGLLSVAENSGNGANSGYLYQSRFDKFGTMSAQDAAATLPGATTSYLKPISFGVMPSGTSDATPTLWALEIATNTLQDSPIFSLPAEHNLRGHLTYRTLEQDDGGLFHPMWDASALEGIESVEGEPVLVRSNSLGFRTTVLDLPYSNTQGVLGSGFFRLRLNRDSSLPDNVRGPLHASFYQAERLGATGASVSTLAWLGGQGFREFGEGIELGSQAFDPADPASTSPLGMYFSRVRALMNEPRVLVRLYYGGNDIYAKQRTAQESEQDARDSIAQLRALWTENGWDDSELYFLIVGWHHRPINLFNGFWEHHGLLELRQRLRSIALDEPRTAYVDMQVLAPGPEMLDEGFWDGLSGASTAHLTQEGYEVLAQRELDALEIRNDCVPDLNGDFHVDSLDLGLLLTGYGKVDYGVDMTHDGMVDSLDLGLLLSFWGPCPSIQLPGFGVPGGSGLTHSQDKVRFFPHAEHKRD